MKILYDMENPPGLSHPSQMSRNGALHMHKSWTEPENRSCLLPVISNEQHQCRCRAANHFCRASVADQLQQKDSRQYRVAIPPSAVRNALHSSAETGGGRGWSRDAVTCSSPARSISSKTPTLVEVSPPLPRRPSPHFGLPPANVVSVSGSGYSSGFNSDF